MWDYYAIVSNIRTSHPVYMYALALCLRSNGHTKNCSFPWRKIWRLMLTDLGESLTNGGKNSLHFGDFGRMPPMSLFFYVDFQKAQRDILK
ncbi:hypothetical protein GDO86_000739 [Hymenochirus boettgeri]|uniref:Uncharacterized protein n=1 Tax=Hymenochirus boettgeri TaxID=247094 RepID=A0A8T2KI06_9PIPI|nr:hypothetical protein GDO86_000739 [Hymenochirus boettgeri]